MQRQPQEPDKRVREPTARTSQLLRRRRPGRRACGKFLQETTWLRHHHFAGPEAGRKRRKPWGYYNNLNSTLVLTKVMRDVGMQNIIFSSSARVYTATNEMPPCGSQRHRRLHQPLRLDQVHDGANSLRHEPRRPQVERVPSTLLQPHRRTPLRKNGRGPGASPPT